MGALKALRDVVAVEVFVGLGQYPEQHERDQTGVQVTLEFSRIVVHTDTVEYTVLDVKR